MSRHAGSIGRKVSTFNRPAVRRAPAAAIFKVESGHQGRRGPGTKITGSYAVLFLVSTRWPTLVTPFNRSAMRSRSTLIVGPMISVTTDAVAEAPLVTCDEAGQFRTF